jgi:hypothetical protein
LLLLSDDPPECNPPSDNYQEGLESYLFKPLREAFIKLLQESKNHTTNNIWFAHVSTWYQQPQHLEADKEFPSLFVLTPSSSFERHSMDQNRGIIDIQFEYYCRHYKHNVTNELEHFVERLLYIIQVNKNVKFGKLIGGVQLCAKNAMPDSAEFDYYVDSSFVTRSATVIVKIDVPLLMVEPP